MVGSMPHPEYSNGARGYHIKRWWRRHTRALGPFHAAALRITNPNTHIFVDVGNFIYKQFLLEVWPTSRLWEYLSNQVTIGDVVEAAFGRIIIDWAEAISLGDPAPRFVDDPIFTRLARMSRICLAAYCDLHMYGIISCV